MTTLDVALRDASPRSARPVRPRLAGRPRTARPRTARPRTSQPRTTQPGAGRRWAVLAVLMLPVLLVSVDNTVLSFAVPAITRALGPSSTQVLWIIDIYPLVLAALLIPMGSLGDRIGRRRLLLLGAVGFAATSAAAAFAPTAGALVAARALLGVFGAMLMPATLALLRNVFTDPGERRLAVAIWATGFSGGAALGPILGGWLLQHFWWGSIFLLAVVMLVPLLIAAPLLVPESRDPRPGPVDPVSIVLIVAAMLPVVYAIKHAATSGSWLGPTLLVMAGIAAGAIFVRRQLARATPMLDVRLFANPVFSGALLVNMFSLFAFVGFLYFLAQHLQLVAGMGPVEAGVWLLPGLALTVVAGLAVVPLARRFSPRSIAVAGLASSSAAYAVVAAAGHTGSAVVLMVAFCLLGIGVGLAETVANDLALSAVPATKSGAASAISETAYEIGAVLGTAVLGSILNVAYSRGVDVPAGLSAAQAEEARATLGGATEVAGDLPAAAGDALLRSAAHAFDSGVTATAAIALAVTVATAVVAHRALRVRTATAAGGAAARRRAAP
ncbi:MFS transporter [Nocardioides pacificus]